MTEVGWLVEEASAALGRLREVWPWLTEARMPGAGRPSTQRLVSERAERIEVEQIRRDRAAKADAIRNGLTPSGPKAAPARVGMLKVRAQVVRQVGGLSVDLVLGVPWGDLTMIDLMDVVARRRRVRCPWCAGSGRVEMPHGWGWAGDPVPLGWSGGASWPAQLMACSWCRGWRDSCGLCGHFGPCSCNDADAVMAGALDAITVALPQVTDADLAGCAMRVLADADRSARAVLSLLADERVIRAPCPACGRRDLVADVSSTRPDEWSVTCRSRLCECRGPGCGCGRAVRWKGRRHRWPSREFGDLADRLGVELPVTQWRRSA